MKVTSSKESSTKSVSRKTKQPALSMLSSCPAGASGWCSYPFSPQQLEKKMKAKAKKQQIEEIRQQKPKKSMKQR
ncbi:MAG: hypothetical protein K2Z81_14260 [Cyanobacteria bacterium]|nr:hypothetical protein [Cyanobacteriota bacterium]